MCQTYATAAGNDWPVMADSVEKLFTETAVVVAILSMRIS
jgi:hypothetical protein